MRALCRTPRFRPRRAPPRALILPLACLLLSTPPSAVWAAGDAAFEAASLISAEGIQGHSFSVVQERTTDGRPWIVMKAEYSAVLQAKPEEILAVLSAYEDIPSVFKRITRVEVIYDKGAEARTRQTTTVRALGLAFTNTLEFLLRYERPSPGTVKQTFTMVGSDGSSLKSEGSWTIESLAPAPAAAFAEPAGAAAALLPASGAGPASPAPRCKVLYKVENWLEPRYPLQETIMRAFGSRDMEDLFIQLADAVRRNR